MIDFLSLPLIHVFPYTLLIIIIISFSLIYWKLKIPLNFIRITRRAKKNAFIILKGRLFLCFQTNTRTYSNGLTHISLCVPKDIIKRRRKKYVYLKTSNPQKKRKNQDINRCKRIWARLLCMLVWLDINKLTYFQEKHAKNYL